MGRLRYAVSMSLDGFVAGPEQSREHPLGLRGELLHHWMRELALWRAEAGLAGGVVNASTEVLAREDDNVGAIIMGRNMFGGGPGPWGEPAWDGWWGDNPPFHLPVFVLTHHQRGVLECQGGTRFEFITGGPEVALDRARRAVGQSDIVVSGGAGVARQYLQAGLVDELLIHLVPVFLGAGTRLFDSPALAAIRMEQQDVVDAPGVTHLTYKIAGEARSASQGDGRHAQRQRQP
jgi:dihydrofolate reductase